MGSGTSSAYVSSVTSTRSSGEGERERVCGMTRSSAPSVTPSQQLCAFLAFIFFALAPLSFFLVFFSFLLLYFYIHCLPSFPRYSILLDLFDPQHTSPQKKREKVLSRAGRKTKTNTQTCITLPHTHTSFLSLSLSRLLSLARFLTYRPALIRPSCQSTSTPTQSKDTIN